MQRRTYIKTVVLGSLLPLSNSGFGFIKRAGQVYEGPRSVSFKSDWQNWPNMKWAGPEYWGNRLQDWVIADGKLVCDITGHNRTLHLLTVQNGEPDAELEISTTVTILTDDIARYNEGCIGLLVGAKGQFDDFRSAAVFGKGLNVGLTPKGRLQVGEKTFETGLEGIPDQFRLVFSNKAVAGRMMVSVKIINPISGKVLFEKVGITLEGIDLEGNFALLANFGASQKTDLELPSVSFENWQISSSSLYQNKTNLFGPICFAQYTLGRKKLKLTAQLAPIEEIEDHKVFLEFKKNGQWKTHEEAKVTSPGRAVNFQIENWNTTTDTPYRVSVQIGVGNTTNKYVYEGTIATEPVKKDELKVAVFSCNAHYGFPDNDIPESLDKLNYDLSVFLGDQFYESTGGFGAQYNGEFDKTCLDYLRKWMMFGWSYREIFRHKPCAIIPDDHDVYHGNVWGEGGKIADTSLGYGAKAQDSGGYKMKPEWVNMVQFTQTSHLPDAFDPTPVKNNIGVYYTHWNYAGVSFAILEDRKFKSAPKDVLPEEADIHNGWIQNKDFDIKKYKDLPADLLGERQEKFLEEWAVDWSDGAQMKAVLSQTNFATVATLPADAINDGVVPSLPLPEKGEYIAGDKPTADMDSNGWPVIKRNKAVELIRKGFAFHIAGDQHLGSFIQYGLDNHGDGGYAFAGPALNNLWPRRFWPPVDYSAHTYEKPAYLGRHIDGFGNKFTLHAVANPFNSSKEPKVLYTRSNGFGMVTFDKKNRTIRTDCYARFKDVDAADAQYPGWPVTVSQEDQLLSNAEYRLPELHIESNNHPLVRVLDSNKEIVYSLPLPHKVFLPKVFIPGTYTVEFYLNNKKVKTLNVETVQGNNERLTITI